MTTLDLVKFRKVWALVGEGGTEGEQDSARVRAEQMARKAGMTLVEAVQAMYAPAPGEPMNPFAGFDDWMEAKEPGHKARCRREKAEREAARAARRSELIDQFGSEEAVFADTPMERDLQAATEHLVTWKHWTDDDGVDHPYVGDLAGWGSFGRREYMPAELREAVSVSVPLPDSVSSAWVELKAADDRQEARCQFNNDHEPSLAMRAREYELEAVMETLPARTFSDIVARLEWAHWLAGRDLFQYRDDSVLARLLSDIRQHDARSRLVAAAAVAAVNRLDRTVREASVHAATSIMEAAEGER